jgi:hypothetical protein
MIGIVLCMTCFLTAIATRASACDPNYCCCPNGPITVTTWSNVGQPMIRFVYNSIPGSRGCASRPQMINCHLRDDGICYGSDYHAKKSGESVAFVVRDPSCDFQLRCQSGSCRTTDDWVGQYSVSSSKSSTSTVTLSAALLLVMTVIGLCV